LNKKQNLFVFGEDVKVYWFFLFAISFFYQMMSATESVSLFIFYVVLIVACLMILFLNRNESVIAFKKTKVDSSFVFFVLMAGVTIYVFGFMLIAFKLNYQLEVFDDSNSIFTNSTKNIYLLCLYLLVIAPLFEEFVFRKYVLALMHNSLIPYASLLTALIFTVFHRNNSVAEHLVIFIFALQANQIYLKTGRLFLTVIFHMANNFTGLVFLLFLKGHNFSNAVFILLGFVYVLLPVIGVICLIVLNVKLNSLVNSKRVSNLLREKVKKGNDFD
jgi:membrane protease YdiL (CAAX protease family)